MDALIESIIKTTTPVIVTAVLGGIFGPMIVKDYEARRAARQAAAEDARRKMEAEAERTRQRQQTEADRIRQQQAEELKAQYSLIDDLTRVIWNWRYLAKKVVYYAAIDNTALYEHARDEYQDKVWGLLAEFRTQCSKSYRLLSKGAYTDFEKFYKYLLDIDKQVLGLIASEKDKEGFRARGYSLSETFSNEVSKQIDETLMKVSDDLKPKMVGDQNFYNG